MHTRSPFSAFPYLSLCIAILFSPYALGSGFDGGVLNNDIDAFITQTLTEVKSPGGVAVAVVRKEARGTWNIETRGYGVATLANGAKVTENTLFAIGSNSKLFNIFATGLLIHNQTLSPPLSWTSKLASLIPQFGLQDLFAFKEATIVDAMSHRTGLPRHDVSSRYSDNTTSIIEKMKYQRPSAEFRDVYQYNNNMYALLSYLPTALLPSKIPFARYVKEHIIDPLGMTATTYSAQVAISSGRLADGMIRQTINTGDAEVIYRALPFWNSDGEDGSHLSGEGGIISNAVDMATWLQTLLLEGVNPKTNISVIPADAVQRAAKGVTVDTNAAPYPELSPTVYGAGQQRGTYRGHEYIAHNGAVPGFISSVFRLPWDNIGVAVLTNDGEFGGLISSVINFRLLDEALGMKPIDWTARFNEAFLGVPSPSPTPRPANASFPFGNFSSITGKYNNFGYGPVEICLVSPKDPNASLSCNALADELPTVLPGSVVPDVPTFFAKWDSFSFTHIRFTHFDGAVFNVSAFASYPTGNASVPYWTYDLGPGVAQAFVDDKLSGIGLTGVWGAGNDVPEPQGNTPQERAEVWFDRV